MLREAQIDTTSYLIKQLPNATVFLTKSLQVAHVSNKWLSTFDMSLEEVLGKTFFQSYKKASKKLKNSISDTLKIKEKRVLTERYVDKNNVEKWFEWDHIPWFDEKENVIGVIVQVFDITKRVNQELKLEKIEILFQEMSEMGTIGSWEYDAVKDELYWCDMTRKIHEVPDSFEPKVEEAINFYKPGYSRNTISMSMDNAMRHGTPWKEKMQIVTSKGKEKWVVAAGKPIFKDNKFIGLIGTFQDIHEQISSEIKTKENEHLLRTLIDNLPLNVFIKDLQSRKILANKAECEYLGVSSPEELLGKNDFDVYDEEAAQLSREEDLSVINTLRPILGKETTGVHKDGRKTSFLTSKIPLIGDDGIAFGIVGISLDITDIKQKEDELRNLINVTSLQNKKLINFAHIVSHNLRSHTANFSMLLDFLVNEKSEKEKNNIVRMLVDASDNLLETLDNLNEVVAISTNTNIEKKPVDINAKIENVEQNLKAFLISNNAEIINTIPAKTKINVVPAYLDSILMNFITNAVKYRSPDRTPIIKLSVEEVKNHTILNIEDNGMGIDLNKYGEKLFGMYKTFHNNADARGIGLYISKNQVEAMNGKIMTYSQVDQGTTFKIYFNDKD